jgi:pyruvate dehydrogenase E2 component (dihydrolipoamide acetyltransferase)
MSESKQRVPHYYLTVELRVDALENAVATLQTTHKDITLTAALVLAAVRAMAAVPAVNSEWRGEVVRNHAHVDVNMLLPGTKATDPVQTPVLRAVETHGLRWLSDELRRLGEAASKGALNPGDSANGTFSVLDLGAYGVQQCAPIIVPNHAAALALGSVETRPQLNPDGEGVRKSRLIVATLSCDHRVVDGAVGAEWLQHFKKLVEEPLNLLL